MIPAFTLRGYTDTSRAASQMPDPVHDPEDLPEDHQILRDRLGLTLADRLYGRLLPRVPRALEDLQIVLFLLCTIPFWTSNVIRMISWIPLLGRNGLVNQG
jgi:putative spermidine/putrescine transport system permease protein